jgi:undecaprenyl-diphosphatase
MSLLESIILGLVQGLTEFIPVSSSGHLVIATNVLNINNAFMYDVLLNFGTLLALILYYRKKIYFIIKMAIIKRQFKLIGLLIIATIPAAVVGLTLDKQIELLNEYIWVVILMLLLVGAAFIVAGKQNTNANDQELDKSISSMTSIRVGIMQAIALIPGTSRSGITILTGMKCGLSAKKAAEFSFLLAIPIISAASFKVLLTNDGLNYVKDNLGAVVVGNLVSFIAGLLAVKFLINLISKRGLKDFGWYRIGLALILIILLLTGII